MTPSRIDRALAAAGASGSRAAALVTAGLAALVVLLVPQAGRGAARRAGCRPSLDAGSHTLQVALGDAARQALVEVPGGGGRRPLVIALHGWGSNAEKMSRYSGLSAPAAAAGFVVAYPSSDGLGWNSTASPTGPDDVALLRALIAELAARACVDARAVFLTGVSNGASMVALAACAMGDELRAIAAVAGDYDQQPPCRKRVSESILEIHGTADQVVRYFGDAGHPTGDGVPPFVNAWVRRDGCSPNHTVRQIAPRTRLYRWTRCRPGIEVEHIQIRGGRHQWPGATPPDPGPPATISAARTIVAFFASQPPQPAPSGGAAVRG